MQHIKTHKFKKASQTHQYGVRREDLDIRVWSKFADAQPADLLGSERHKQQRQPLMRRVHTAALRYSGVSMRKQQRNADMKMKVEMCA